MSKKIIIPLVVISMIAIGVIIFLKSASQAPEINKAGSNKQNENTTNVSPAQPAENANINAKSAGGDSTKQLSFTAAEVALHNSEKDCWLIINKKIYNVTEYLPYHKGKPETILPYCGKDATSAFQTKGEKGKPHSDKALELLNTFYIGELKI